MALTTAKQFETVMGDKVVGCYKITGDGSVTTWDAPLGVIDAAWYQRGTDTATDEKLTWSGVTITWSTVIPTSTYGYLFYIGS